MPLIGKLVRQQTEVIGYCPKGCGNPLKAKVNLTVFFVCSYCKRTLEPKRNQNPNHFFCRSCDLDLCRTCFKFLLDEFNKQKQLQQQQQAQEAMCQAQQAQLLDQQAMAQAAQQAQQMAPELAQRMVAKDKYLDPLDKGRKERLHKEKAQWLYKQNRVLWEEFCNIDTDADGLLSFEEIFRWIERSERADYMMRHGVDLRLEAEKLMKKMDLDRNGKVTFEEFKYEMRPDAMTLQDFEQLRQLSDSDWDDMDVDD